MRRGRGARRRDCRGVRRPVRPGGRCRPRGWHRCGCPVDFISVVTLLPLRERRYRNSTGVTKSQSMAPKESPHIGSPMCRGGLPSSLTRAPSTSRRRVTRRPSTANGRRSAPGRTMHHRDPPRPPTTTSSAGGAWSGTGIRDRHEQPRPRCQGRRGGARQSGDRHEILDLHHGPVRRCDTAQRVCRREVELVVVIGVRAYQVSQASAWDYVAGVMVRQDLSERVVQLASGGQFSLGKSFPGFGPAGPRRGCRASVRRCGACRRGTRRRARGGPGQQHLTARFAAADQRPGRR
jgi:hypothetical protein